MSNFKAVNDKIADKVVGAYQKIEDTVVGGYKTVENTVVSGYEKVEDGFVNKFLTKDGETVKEAKQRLKQGV